MPYPWFSFGNFLFEREETPLLGSDTGWAISPSIARARALGSTTDSVLTVALGSMDRSFDLLLSPARYAALQALAGTTAVLTDWKRPTPDTRNAVLSGVVLSSEEIMVRCHDGTRQLKRRVTLSFISQ